MEKEKTTKKKTAAKSQHLGLTTAPLSNDKSAGQAAKVLDKSPHLNVVKMRDKKVPAVKPVRAKKVKASVKIQPAEVKSAKKAAEPRVEPAVETVETKSAPRYFYAIGRRKRSRAIVRIFTRGQGNILVNKEDWKKYFPTVQLSQVIEAPLIEAGQRNNVNIEISVEGGGKQGQAGAVSLGIARALLKLNPVFRRALRRHGFLTRDSREKERKKYGLKKARRAPQFAKR